MAGFAGLQEQADAEGWTGYASLIQYPPEYFSSDTTCAECLARSGAERVGVRAHWLVLQQTPKGGIAAVPLCRDHLRELELAQGLRPESNVRGRLAGR